ncbi:MAG: hypothetical protein WKG07_24310 [Hymenobacter sp.]
MTTEDGTGIVHISPTFGADDFRAAQLGGHAGADGAGCRRHAIAHRGPHGLATCRRWASLRAVG